MKIKDVYLFDNGNLAVFDISGQQMPELQGQYSIDTHKRILLLSDSNTHFKGFNILPGGFMKTVNDWAGYFKSRNMTWEEIQAI